MTILSITRLFRMYVWLGLIVYISVFTSIYTSPRVRDVDPDALKNVSQLITSKGYPFEEHFVETEDGYILGLHRIPHGRQGSSSADRPVVLLQHGLLSCSACWVENLVNQSLGFILADKGMDVWLGNSRGNTYSKRHKTIKPSDEKFWQFSWDHMARYDLPAMVDYILKETNVPQIYYAGHSQGTEIIFAGLGRNATLAAKIKHFFALAPVATIGSVEGPFKNLAPFAIKYELLFELLGKGQLFPTSEFIRMVGRDICGEGSVGGIVCENFLFFLAGYDSKEMNVTRIPVYIAEHPAGTSVQNLVHYAQQLQKVLIVQEVCHSPKKVTYYGPLSGFLAFLYQERADSSVDRAWKLFPVTSIYWSVLSGKFQMFDYGSAKTNMEHYNQTTPPLYDASMMKNSVTLYTGGKDILADPTDVQYLLKQLPNIYQHVDISYWEHLDFIWAIDANVKCYDNIVSTIQKFESH